MSGFPVFSNGVTIMHLYDVVIKIKSKSLNQYFHMRFVTMAVDTQLAMKEPSHRIS